MADSNMQLNWSDEQWNKVRQVVYEEARKARVAGNFLPLYGPLEPDATYVTKEELTYPPFSSGPLERMSVNNTETLPLVTLEILLYLRGAQVADPDLASALTAFRRAANVLSRVEDIVIFHGKPPEAELHEVYQVARGKRDETGIKTTAGDQLKKLHPIWSISGPDKADGLVDRV